jgi:hypothetical protein
MTQILPLFKPANLCILLDANHYYPGSILSGKVVFDVLYETIDGDSLSVRVLGEERTVIRLSKEDTRHETSIFFHSSQTLAHSDDGLFRKGRFEYPFSFELAPTNVLLPYFHAELGGGSCWIDYSVETKLHRKGIFKWSVECKVPFHVWTLPTMDPDRSLITVPVLSKEIRFLWAWDTGIITMGLSCSPGCLSAGEEFEIHYIIGNHSTSTIKAVLIGVYQNVHIQSEGEKYVMKQPVFQKRLEKDQLEMNVDPAQRNLYQHNLSTIELQKQLDMQRFRLKGKICEIKGEIMPIPAFSGKLLQVHYTVELQVLTTFGTSNPSISRPVSLYAKPWISTDESVLIPAEHFHDNPLIGRREQSLS